MKEVRSKEKCRREGGKEWQIEEERKKGRHHRNVFFILKVRYEMNAKPLQQKHDSSSCNLLLLVPRVTASGCFAAACPA